MRLRRLSTPLEIALASNGGNGVTVELNRYALKVNRFPQN
jgi:hypothetical protein